MDKVITYAFMRAVTTKLNKSDLPILVSTFSANYLMPCRPTGSNIDIKASSFKKMNKFLAHMQEQGIVKVAQLSEVCSCYHNSFEFIHG